MTVAFSSTLNTHETEYTHCIIVSVAYHFPLGLFLALEQIRVECDCEWVTVAFFFFLTIHWTKCTHCIICLSLSHRTILGSWTGSLCSCRMWFWMSEHSLFQHIFEYPLNKIHTLYHYCCYSLLWYCCFSLVFSRLAAFITCHMWFWMCDCNLFQPIFEYPPKCCTHSTNWLIHGWCLFETATNSVCPIYIHHEQLYSITSFKATYIGCMCV